MKGGYVVGEVYAVIGVAGDFSVGPVKVADGVTAEPDVAGTLYTPF